MKRPHPSPLPQTGEEDEALGEIERALASHEPDAARTALLAWLRERAAVGDGTAAVTLRVLAQGRFAPDATAAAVDRLLALTQAQEGQIRALMALLEERL